MGKVKELLTPEGPLPDPDFDSLWGDMPETGDLDVGELQNLQVHMLIRAIEQVVEVMDHMIYREKYYFEQYRREEIETLRKSLNNLVRYFC
jgi:hypothetical protein